MSISSLGALQVTPPSDERCQCATAWSVGLHDHVEEQPQLAVGPGQEDRAAPETNRAPAITFGSLQAAAPGSRRDARMATSGAVS